MINPNFTLLIQMCVVLILTLVLNILFFQPLVKLINNRRIHVKKAQSDEEDTKNNIIELNKRYEDAITKAKEKALQDRENIRKVGLDKERDILEQAHKEHADAIHEAGLKIKKEFEEAQKEIDSHIKILSISVAEKILQRKIQ